jgi:hypothetical protein
VADAHFCFAADSEGDIAHDIVHDFRNGPLNLRKCDIGPEGKISTADIESNTTERNLVLVSDDPADRLGVTFVSIGTKHTAFSPARETCLDLLERRLVVLAKNLYLIDFSTSRILCSDIPLR